MKQSLENKMSRATVWGWGDDFEAVRINSERYVSKRWKATTKEGAIGLTAIERDEGTIFYIAAFISDLKKVGELAQRMLYAALGLKGDIKVDFVTIFLSQDTISEKELYRDSLEHVEDEYERCEQALVKKVGADARVKTKAEGRKIVVIPKVSITCELESDYANKVVVDATDSDLTRLKNFLHSLSKRLIEEGLAKRTVGFELSEDIEKLEIDDVYVQGDEVYVWLV